MGKTRKCTFHHHSWVKTTPCCVSEQTSLCLAAASVMADADEATLAGEAAIEAAIEEVSMMEQEEEEANDSGVLDSDAEADMLVSGAVPLEEDEDEDEDEVAEDAAAVSTQAEANKEEANKVKAADVPGGSEQEAAGSKAAVVGNAAAGGECSASAGGDAGQAASATVKTKLVSKEVAASFSALEEQSSWVDCSKEQAPVMAWSGKRDVFFKLADTIEEVRDDDERGLMVDRDHIITVGEHEYRVVCSISMAHTQYLCIGGLYTIFSVQHSVMHRHSVPVISSLSLFQGSWSLIQALKYHRIR